MHHSIVVSSGTARFCGALCVMLAGISQAAPTAAQASDTFRSKRPSETLPWALKQVSDPADADAASPGRLYEDALEDFRSGHRSSGQRRLELLIARFPGSALADEARRKLVELYARDTQIGTQRSALGAPPPTVAAPDEWRTDVSRGPNAADDFRLKAGERVFFSTGSAELGGRAASVLKAQAVWLNARPWTRCEVEGHSDDPGSASENRLLAERRAAAVRDRLIAEGVDVNRISVTAHGTDRRVAVCTGSDCSAQNRRVVSVIQVVGTPTRAATETDRSLAGRSVPR